RRRHLIAAAPMLAALLTAVPAVAAMAAPASHRAPQAAGFLWAVLWAVMRGEHHPPPATVKPAAIPAPLSSSASASRQAARQARPRHQGDRNAPESPDIR